MTEPAAFFFGHVQLVIDQDKPIVLRLEFEQDLAQEVVVSSRYIPPLSVGTDNAPNP